jgi:hypothetical protein
MSRYSDRLAIQGRDCMDGRRGTRLPLNEFLPIRLQRIVGQGA